MWLVGAALAASPVGGQVELPAWAHEGTVLHYGAAVTPSMLEEPFDVTIVALKPNVELRWALPKHEAAGTRTMDLGAPFYTTLFENGESGALGDAQTVFVSSLTVRLINDYGRNTRSLVNSFKFGWKYGETRTARVQVDGVDTEVTVWHLEHGNYFLDILPTAKFPLVVRQHLPPLSGSATLMDVHAMHLKSVETTPMP